MIYVYSEQNATDDLCVQAVIARLHDYGVGSERIKQLNASGLAEIVDKQDTGILIIPGGHTFHIDCAWHRADPKLQNKVAEAVKRGWNCLGFCAGANILCEKMEFFVPKFSRHFDENYMGALPLTAHAPAFLSEDALADHGREVPLVTPEGTRFRAYWNDGSYFTPNPFYSYTPIRAYYDEGKPNPRAAVRLDRSGQGTVAVSGVHPEFPLTNETAENQAARVQFLWNLFASVGIHKDSTS